MPAERDLARLLATLDVERRPGTFAYVQRSPDAAAPAGLAAVGIPANVPAGFDHDHLLVPEALADDAIAAIRALSGGSPAAAP